MTNETLSSFDPDVELEAWIMPTPLSDPVFTAIFQSADVSGLAMKSLLNATLEDSGDKPVSEVISVTPQSIHAETSMRGYRIDVEAKMVGGEIARTTKSLHHWLTAICRAQDNKLSLMEVVKMDSQLQEFYKADPGFAQFVERHGFVAASPEVRKAYRRWEYDMILDKLEEERKVADQAAQVEEGRAEGRAEGISDTLMDVAMRILKLKGHNTSKTVLDDEMLALGISREIIAAARKQYEELEG